LTKPSHGTEYHSVPRTCSGSTSASSGSELLSPWVTNAVPPSDDDTISVTRWLITSGRPLSIW